MASDIYKKTLVIVMLACAFSFCPAQGNADKYTGTWTDSSGPSAAHDQMTISKQGNNYIVTFIGKDSPKGKHIYKNDRGILKGDAGDIYYVPSSGRIRVRGHEWVKSVK